MPEKVDSSYEVTASNIVKAVSEVLSLIVGFMIVIEHVFEEHERLVNELASITGFDKLERMQLLEKTGWGINEAISNIKNYVSGTTGSLYSKMEIENGIKNAGLYEKLSSNLSNLNTMRGGTKGFKGFVFEELHATNATINGQVTNVINNNGIADFAIVNTDGTITYAQAKAGYNNGNIDFPKYEGQKIVIDKGNTYVINKAKEAGFDVIESDVSLKESVRVAKQMQLETKFTRNSNSVIVPKVHAAINIAKESHNAGLQSAKTGGQFGGGFSLGSNLVDVFTGNKNIDDVAKDVVKDTAISTGIGYATGAVATAVGSTMLGATVTGAIGTATSAIAGTAIGGSAIATGSAVVGAIGGVGTAVATTTVAAGTAIGGAVASTAVGTAIASTAIGGAAIAAGAAAATAMVAAAPIVAVGAVGGAIYSIGKEIFG